MSSRDALATKGRRTGERTAAHPPSLPSQHRPSAKSYTNGAQKPSKSVTTSLRSRPDQGEESDHAQSSSDVSMEDGSEGNPRKPFPSAQSGDVKRCAYGDTKSAGQFMVKIGRAIEEGTEYIEWAEEGSGALSIRNDERFAKEALPKHFKGIKPASFDKQLRNYGYQKKKITGPEGPGSLWVRKEAPPLNEPTCPNPVQERPLTANVPVAAGMAPRPSSQLDLEGFINELQHELRATRSELSATRSELSATRSELSATRSELGATRSELNAARMDLGAARSESNATRVELNATRSELSAARLDLGAARSELNATRSELSVARSEMFGMHTIEPSSIGNGSSHSATNSVPDAPRFSQTDEANGYNRIPDEFPPNVQTGAYGVGSQQAVHLGLETRPSYDSADPTFLARHPAQPQSFGCNSESNPGFPETYADEYTMPGGSFSHTFWIPQVDLTTIPQGAGTNSGHQQNSMHPTGAPSISHFDPPVTSLPPIPSTSQAPTRHQPPNPSGAYGGPRGPMSVVHQVPVPGIQ
ncbi:hypothetical protein FRC00_005435 [Tulasnella sp. 408]|nr:hypothetical protein FRC00_005435 [Tulasnella sp. 408]